MKSIGEQLKEAREARNWTLEAAAKATKIRGDQLDDLEKNDYGRFASPSYARGFIRLYAKTLGLNERKLTRQLDGVFEEGLDDVYVAAPPVEYLPEQVTFNELGGVQRAGWVFGLGLLGLFVVITILTLVRFYHNVVRARPVPVPAVVTVVTPPAVVSNSGIPVAPSVPDVAPVKVALNAPTPVPTPAKALPAMNHKLVLVAKEDSWVRVMSAGGGDPAVLFEDVLSAGDRKEFSAPRFTVKMAVPADVQIIFDDKDYGTYSEEKLPQEFNIPADNN